MFEPVRIKLACERWRPVSLVPDGLACLWQAAGWTADLPRLQPFLRQEIPKSQAAHPRHSHVSASSTVRFATRPAWRISRRLQQQHRGRVVVRAQGLEQAQPVDAARRPAVQDDAVEAR